MGQPYYATFAKHLTSIVDGDMSLFHVDLSLHPSASKLTPDGAPVTEVIGHYFSASSSESERSSFESDLNEFATVAEENAEGYKGFLGGWAVEELDHPKVEGKARLWQSLIGWDSVDAHMAFRETDAFKESVHLMRPETLKASTLYHVSFQSI